MKTCVGSKDQRSDSGSIPEASRKTGKFDAKTGRFWSITPWKINMEHKSWRFGSDDFPFQTGDDFRFQPFIFGAFFRNQTESTEDVPFQDAGLVIQDDMT